MASTRAASRRSRSTTVAAHAAGLGAGDVGGVGRAAGRRSGRRAGRRPARRASSFWRGGRRGEHAGGGLGPAAELGDGGGFRHDERLSGTRRRPRVAPCQTSDAPPKPTCPRSAGRWRPRSTAIPCGPTSPRREAAGPPGPRAWFEAEARAQLRGHGEVLVDDEVRGRRHLGAAEALEGHAPPRRVGHRRPVGSPVPVAGCSAAMQNLSADGAAPTPRTRSTGTWPSSAPTPPTRAAASAAP